MKTRIKLLLVPAMAIAMLALGLWFGLVVSATPAYADDGSAPADETAIVDETTPADETAIVDETTPTDETAIVDETTPTDETAIVDETAPADETTTVDETAPADETAIVDETAPADEVAVPATTGATVQTDQADYAFDETPVITGTGFPANSTVDVTVTAPDGTVTTFTATTDSEGNWTANYAGPMGGGTFSVTATEGAMTAATTFTDADHTYFSLNAPLDITAGSRAAYTVTHYHQNNTLNTTGSRTVYLYTDSTGANADFYNLASGGSVITQVTIPNGSSSANFWYYDEKADTVTITVSDATPSPDGNPGIKDDSDNLTVNPGPAATLLVSGYPSPTTAGESHNFTVTAKDTYGNTATGYTGTVHFTSSDSSAGLPSNHTFTSGNNGVHNFSATLNTVGTQSLTATDTVTSSITGTQSGIIVPPSIDIDDVSVNEGVSAVFTVTLSAASTDTVTVEYDTHHGSATAGSDYTSTSGTLTFGAGVTSQTITVLTVNDTAKENDETFYVELSNPTNATIYDDEGKGTILANDTPPTVTGVYSSNASGTPTDSFLTTGNVYAHITTLGGSPGGTISVNIYVTADQTTWTSWPVEDPLNDVTPGGCVNVDVPTGGGTFLIWSANTAAGNYDIVVDVNKDGHYGCPVNLDVVDSIAPIGFTVSKADATIVVTPYTETYDGTEYTATGTATGVSSGDLDYLLHLGDTAHTNAGDYLGDPWTFDGNAVYNSASGTVDDFINQAPLTVTADDKGKLYGEDVPAFTASYTGFVLGEDEGDLGGTLTFACSATASSPVGDYDITPSGYTSGNYDITFVKGTLTINQATLTATAEDKTITYGDAEPTYTISHTGFVSGDDQSDLDTLPTATVSGPHTDAGTYSIVPSGGLDNNYTFSYVNGTLTINKADATIAVTPYDVTYDGNAHTATGTATGVNLEDLSGLLTLSGTTHTDAGDYPSDPWTFTGNTNYNSANGTVHDIITEAPLALAGGAAPRVLVLSIDWFGIVRYYRVTAAGVLLEDVNITSPDGTATLVIPAGTLVLDADGLPLYLHRDNDITVTTAGTPAAPAGTTFAAVYELLPSGVIFEHGEAGLIVTYDPATVTPGSVLVIAYYDEATGEWVEIDTAGYVVGGETVSNTVVGHFAHFTYFALLVKLPAE
jgi:hypothetical protein